jgi:hypothetical protein
MATGQDPSGVYQKALNLAPYDSKLATDLNYLIQFGGSQSSSGVWADCAAAGAPGY